LVVSPACFARAESRSSLKSDSLPPCDWCVLRAADVSQPPCSGTWHWARAWSRPMRTRS